MIKNIYKTSLSLLTDLYQLTMTYGYWKKGIHNNYASFNLFFRTPTQASTRVSEPPISSPNRCRQWPPTCVSGSLTICSRRLACARSNSVYSPINSPAGNVSVSASRGRWRRNRIWPSRWRRSREKPPGRRRRSVNWQRAAQDRGQWGIWEDEFAAKRW